MIGGLVARFLVAPDLKFKLFVVVLEEIIVAFTIKVYVAAPVLADITISCSWQNVLEASLVDKLISKETLLLITIMSSPIKVQEVVFDDITTFLL